MTLDEIEKVARIADVGALTRDAQKQLARALLAVLPVVRAAENLVDNQHGFCDRDCLAVMYAIDQMREGLKC